MKPMNRRSMRLSLAALAAALMVPGCGGGGSIDGGVIEPTPPAVFTLTPNGSNVNKAPFTPAVTDLTFSPVTPEGLQGVGIQLLHHDPPTETASEYRVLNLFLTKQGPFRAGDEYTLT